MSSSFRLRTSAAVLLSLVLVAATALPAHAGKTPEVFIQGVLTDSSGVPLPAETVTLVAWPSAESQAAIAAGEDVPTQEVATSTTDESGHFAFGGAILEDQLAYFANGSAIVDLTVESDAGGEPHVYALSRYLPRLVAANGGIPEAPPELDTDPIVVEGVVPDEPDAGDPAATTPIACAWKKVSTLGARWVQVGSAYTAGGTTASFSYKVDTTSSVGVGISASGRVGTFKVSGTSVVTSSSTITFPSVSGTGGKRIWRTQFVFAKYKRDCVGTSYDMTKVSAVKPAGGASYTTPSVAPTTLSENCAVFLANSTFTKSSTRASTYSASLAADIGIDLTSTTGYSATAKVKFTFTSGKRLCGTKGLPADTPGVLVAKT